jgi:hypothetical protein
MLAEKSLMGFVLNGDGIDCATFYFEEPAL